MIWCVEAAQTYTIIICKFWYQTKCYCEVQTMLLSRACTWNATNLNNSIVWHRSQLLLYTEQNSVPDQHFTKIKISDAPNDSMR
ncbi:Dynein heavy chain, cytoplasmic [Dirofilaria immitis]